jgi:hypothetical protein
MKRVIKLCLLLLLITASTTGYAKKANKQQPMTTREYWVATLDKIARPVISSLAQGKLKETMPIETRIDRAYRVSYLEAFGRTFCGIAPWLELGPDETKEGQLRKEYIDMTIKAIDMATNPESKDFMNFTTDQQPLVDAAFFAQGLIRSKTQIWDKLDKRVKQQVVDCLKSTRAIRTPTNNWLLFSGTIEAFLLDNDLGGDLMRIDYAVNQHLQRYKGDATYGDGDEFHWDYYNSFVIQPMLSDIATILNRHKLMDNATFAKIESRLQRYASVLELFISPEGTYPPMGRSLCYRTGVFQALGQVALQKNLSPKISPAQVRCALTAVIKRTMEAPNTFDGKGWLRIGVIGSQPSLAEDYINTGSLYFCTTGFLPLGLAPSDSFWVDPDAEWTSVKIWKGEDVKADHRL